MAILKTFKDPGSTFNQFFFTYTLPVSDDTYHIVSHIRGLEL